MNQPIDVMDLEQQIVLLRQQLEDAEDLRRAISHGEVDAFVVGPTEDTKRVLMLSGAYSRYRQLVEDMQQGAVTVARSGEIMFANHSFAELLELRPIDLFRVPLQRYVDPADASKLGGVLSPRAGQPDIKVNVVGREGKRRPVRISLVSSNDDFITLLFTERDETEDEADATIEAIRTGSVDALVVGGEKVVMLDSAQRFYQAAVDRMQQGVVIVGAQGEVAYANQRMATLLGTNRERLVGSSLLKLAPNADEPALKSILNAHQGASAQAEVRLRRADNQFVTTLVTVTAIADGQKMCLVSDISLQKRHEATDERTRKFLGMMAHEFRNILSPVRNSVEFMKRHNSLDPECRKMVEVIDRQSARLLALVEDLRNINPRD
ncbi:MAG TPA: PAS domain-containing protein [Burkholderiales bacterium]|nr:PAS domain-containing protein [Burkholderiales bacterium]